MCTEHSGVYAKKPVKNIPRLLTNMPGFYEEERHNGMFTEMLSNRAVAKRQRSYDVSDYFRRYGLCVNYVKHRVTGNYLYFKYNMQTPMEPQTFERKVYLGDYTEIDKPIRFQKRVDVWWTGNGFIQN